MPTHPLPYFVADIGEAAIAEVVETLRSGWLTRGPKTQRFEEDFARHVGARHAVAVNSCTAALHLALATQDFDPQDEVVIPSMTFAATAEVAIHLGLKPVLADIDSNTLNLTAATLERVITNRTRAVVPVHFAGQPCDMDPIVELARAHDLIIVEDAAHAFPATYHGRMIGTIGDASCFSFYANKTITTGEGGMLTTDSNAIATKARALSLHGLSPAGWTRSREPASWNYEIVSAGYKYNLSDVAASLGVHQLERADEFLAARQSIAAVYDGAFAPIAWVKPLEVIDKVTHAWHLYVIRLDLRAIPFDRNTFIRLLSEEGIGTSVHYKPLHLHQFYRDHFGYKPHDCPAATEAYGRVISLPIYPRMTIGDAERVVDAVLRVGARAP